MPVSKKRKKDGKPVHRSAPKAPSAGEPGENEAHPSGTPVAQRANRPSNPFVANQPGRRASQRGR